MDVLIVGGLEGFGVRLAGARWESGARIRDWGIKEKAGRVPGGWTRLSTQKIIVHLERLVKIIIERIADSSPCSPGGWRV